MGKKLVSVWVDSEHIERIKAEKPISEFIRNAIEEGLKSSAYQMGTGADINQCIFCIEHGIPLMYADYVSLLSDLDVSQTVDILTEEENKMFAIVTAKILQIRYPKIMMNTKGEASYFVHYLSIAYQGRYEHNSEREARIARANGCYGFEDYVSFLLFGLKVERLYLLGMIKALYVCMRDKIFINDADNVLILCNSLNSIFLKLAKHMLNGTPKILGNYPFGEIGEDSI